MPKLAEGTSANVGAKWTDLAVACSSGEGQKTQELTPSQSVYYTLGGIPALSLTLHDFMNSHHLHLSPPIRIAFPAINLYLAPLTPGKLTHTLSPFPSQCSSTAPCLYFTLLSKECCYLHFWGREHTLDSGSEVCDRPETSSLAES